MTEEQTKKLIQLEYSILDNTEEPNIAITVRAPRYAKFGMCLLWAIMGTLFAIGAGFFGMIAWTEPALDLFLWMSAALSALSLGFWIALWRAIKNPLDNVLWVTKEGIGFIVGDKNNKISMTITMEQAKSAKVAETYTNDYLTSIHIELADDSIISFDSAMPHRQDEDLEQMKAIYLSVVAFLRQNSEITDSDTELREETSMNVSPLVLPIKVPWYMKIFHSLFPIGLGLVATSVTGYFVVELINEFSVTWTYLAFILITVLFAFLGLAGWFGLWRVIGTNGSNELRVEKKENYFLIRDNKGKVYHTVDVKSAGGVHLQTEETNGILTESTLGFEHGEHLDLSVLVPGAYEVQHLNVQVQGYLMKHAV